MKFKFNGKYASIKWMAIGVIATITTIFSYNNIDKIKELNLGTKNKFEIIKVNPAFAQYISAFTTGYISSGSTIKIKFTSQIQESVTLNTPIEEKLFSFDDDIEGETVWTDAQTLEFRPKNRLKAGETYNATFYLHKLLGVIDELKEFEFNFKVVEQSIKLEFNDLMSYSNEDFSYYRSAGTLYTADFAESSEIENALKANYDGQSVYLKWNHDAKNNSHKFYIDSIARGVLKSSKLTYTWDGTSVKTEDKGEKNFSVPAKNSFTLLNVQVVSDAEQYLRIALSNPVSSNQSFEGLITLGELKDFKFVTDNNHIRIYTNEIKTGNYKIKISSAIRDAKNNNLDKSYENQIAFEEIKPSVSIVGKGVILPSSNGLSMPFEAVNLKAIDVKILKLYENNILQYLQTNDLDGDNELVRVGKTIVEKTISLGITNPADFKIKKKFSLELSKILKAEPGAIYRVTLSFKKSYSTYSCAGSSNKENIELEKIVEKNFYNEQYGYYYNNYEYIGEEEDYDWNQSDNPCNGAYYQSYKTSVSRNLLASDIGLTVKRNNDGDLFFAAANLITALPISNLEIELYDYQQQFIERAKTNSDGMLFLSPKEKPYFIIAKNDVNKTYLKLEDASSLSLTLFDTQGESIQKGLKGFIYGERGVWRPGDTLFLSFILEDKLKNLPANHPIIFELRNPQGLVYKKMLKAKGLDGFYTFPVVTDVNAPTGNWTALCKVGAIEFTKNIRIETVMPNRLKLNININEGKVISAKASENFLLHANWLTGAIAKNLAASVSVSLSTKKTTFNKYKTYQFDDITQKFESENLNLFDGKLNENGDVKFPLKINTKSSATGFLNANIVSRVYESGGAFSVDRFSFTYSPFEKYVGIQLPEGEKNSGILYTDRKHEIKIATVNSNGEPIGCSNLKVQVYKLDWRWWWDQYEDDLANYITSDYHKPVYTQNISTRNGAGSFNLEFDEEDWGRYLIRVSDIDGGHSSAITTYFDYPNWMDRGGQNNKIIASMLHFSAEKENYKCNEDAIIDIPSPKGGRALITIETGSKILEAHWLETTKGNTKFKFKVTPEMAPNIYVHVSLLQPHAQTVNDLPIRLYGVIPIRIDDPETHLRPIIKMPEVLAPETNTNIMVAEENGKEMTYTIAVVDEGLLDLTRFKTPDPWTNFYAREALGIKTWDIYDYVIGAYGGELERILSIGGDGNQINKDAAKANRFKPLVKFMGPFHIKKGEKKNHSFKMPMYIGSVRTMVIAGYNGAYGSAEKTSAVKSPIMILGTLPRVLSVDEEVQLPVSVFGGDANIKNATISVECNSLLEVIGNKSQAIKVKQNNEEIVTFNLKVKKEIGVAKVNINAVSGNKSSHYSIELDVRNPNPYRTDVKEMFVDAGKELESNYSGIGINGTNSGSLEISSLPPINLESRLNYLISYPHGCIEQTSSAAFAQLYIDEITTLSNTRKASIESNIKAAIARLQKFQLSDGSFSYWPGDNYTNDWGSVYASHFLFCAEKKGYEIPLSMKQASIKYQQSTANNWDSNKGKFQYSDYLETYRLYILALANKPALSAMNRMREEKTLSLQAKWKLAAAYSATNNDDVAEKIINQLTTGVKKYDIDYYTFGSTERDEAMILETLCQMNKKNQAFAMLKEVSQNLSSRNYLSTQSTAYSLLAVSSYIKKYGSSSSLQVEVLLNGKSVKLAGNSAINSIPIDFSKNISGNLKIINKGKGLLYARLINKGKPAIGSEIEEQESIVTEMKFKSEQNQIIDVSNLKQGTNFTMEVTIKNPGMKGNLENIALLNYIPSGWEIHNARMDDTEESLQNSKFDYQDIRDDKIMTYFNLKANESKTFKFKLNASYSGSYYLPGINVEAMYDSKAYSRKTGKWIKVSR